MSTPADTDYIWPDDWFSSVRAARVQRATRNLLRQVKALTKDWGEVLAYPYLDFENVVLDSTDAAAHNFTGFRPYEPGELHTTLKDLTIQGAPDEETIGIRSALAKLKSDPASVAPCFYPASFEELLRFVSRKPVTGYLFGILSSQYVAGMESFTAFNLQINPRLEGETFGRVWSASWPAGVIATDAEGAQQIGSPPPSAQMHTEFVNVLREHKKSVDQVAVESHLIAIPIHTLHRWGSPSYGAFLGWLFLWKKTKAVDAEALMKNMWPLLDDFAASLFDGEMEDVLESYKSEVPLQFLKANVAKISGWTTREDCLVELGESRFYHNLFEQDGQVEGIAIRLNGKHTQENDAPEWLHLKPKPTTKLSDDPKLQEFLCKSLAYRLRRFHKTLDQLQAKAVIEELKKYKQMMEQLAAPLNNVSEALTRMQKDTQELRAVLFDPAKALFNCAPLLEELFHEGAEIPVGQTVKVKVSHQVTNYTGTDDDHFDDQKDPNERRDTEKTGRTILAIALCRIFGCTEALEQARYRQEVISYAQAALAERFASPAFRELSEDLRWLLQQSGKTVAEILSSNPTQSLKHLKHALFDPFKLNAKAWFNKVFSLAVRSYAKDKTSLIHEGDGDAIYKDMDPAATPVTVQSALAFFMEAAAEAENRSPKCKVERIELRREPDPLKSRSTKHFHIECTFESVYLNGGWSDTKRLIYRHILRKETRDWRIDLAVAGNFQKPYLDLAGKLLGIGTDWSPECGDADDVIYLKKVNSSNQFKITHSMTGQKSVLKMMWLNLS